MVINNIIIILIIMLTSNDSYIQYIENYTSQEHMKRLSRNEIINISEIVEEVHKMADYLIENNEVELLIKKLLKGFGHISLNDIILYSKKVDMKYRLSFIKIVLNKIYTAYENGKNDSNFVQFHRRMATHGMLIDKLENYLDDFLLTSEIELYEIYKRENIAKNSVKIDHLLRFRDFINTITREVFVK